ncbi:hypothetical protein P4S68_04945 [Pseudoalteromonas sp. Hal099]
MDILRELAFSCGKNHDDWFGLYIYEKTQVLRPNGPLINKKIRLYERKIDNANNEKKY